MDETGTIKDIALLVLPSLVWLQGFWTSWAWICQRPVGRDFDWLIAFGCRTPRVVSVRV